MLICKWWHLYSFIVKIFRLTSRRHFFLPIHRHQSTGLKITSIFLFQHLIKGAVDEKHQIWLFGKWVQWFLLFTISDSWRILRERKWDEDFNLLLAKSLIEFFIYRGKRWWYSTEASHILWKRRPSIIQANEVNH